MGDASLSPLRAVFSYKNLVHAVAGACVSVFMQCLLLYVPVVKSLVSTNVTKISSIKLTIICNTSAQSVLDCSFHTGP